MTATASQGSAVDAVYVAVVGPGDDPDEDDIETEKEIERDVESDLKRDMNVAKKVGKELAQRGAILVCGGLGGVMKAACEGVYESNQEKETSRLAIGLLPGNDRHEGNTYLSVALPTGLDQLRNGLVVSVSDAVIAVGCNWGTLSEIALAMRMSKPTVLIANHGWELRYSHNLPREEPFVVSSAEEAVEKAMIEVAARRAKQADGT
jgi:uncharacterized protein (TIGR00725 family)